MTAKQQVKETNYQRATVERSCQEEEPRKGGLSYLCTRPFGHPGPHAAHGTSDTEPYAVWDDKR